jgi:hypothetical protein
LLQFSFGVGVRARAKLGKEQEEALKFFKQFNP